MTVGVVSRAVCASERIGMVSMNGRIDGRDGRLRVCEGGVR